jgi:hypothetical protein
MFANSKRQEKEHHVETFDATSFFVLHDLDHDDQWYALSSSTSVVECMRGARDID